MFWDKNNHALTHYGFATVIQHDRPKDMPVATTMHSIPSNGQSLANTTG
jgi:hypothetical protein